MGALRQKMIEEIRLRNFSPRTEQSYVSAMVGLAKYYRESPDQLSQEQIRAYLLPLCILFYTERIYLRTALIPNRS